MTRRVTTGSDGSKARTGLVASVAVALAVTTAGCSANGGISADGPDEPLVFNGSSERPGCNELLGPGEASAFSMEPAHVPAATGGAIQDGLYRLSAIRVYGAEGRIRGPGTAMLWIHEGRFESAFVEGLDAQRVAGKLTLAGNHFDLLATCRANESMALPHPRGEYRADGIQVTLYEPFRAATVAYEYVRVDEASALPPISRGLQLAPLS
jgi:hypothetical protein